MCVVRLFFCAFFLNKKMNMGYNTLYYDIYCHCVEVVFFFSFFMIMMATDFFIIIKIILLQVHMQEQQQVWKNDTPLLYV